MEIKDELLDIDGIKRSNKPLLDLFIRRTSVLAQTSEHITDLIIRDQWRNASKVSSPNTSISEIEFPNMGTFYISRPKALRKIKSCEVRIEKVLSLYEPGEKQDIELNKMKETIGKVKNKIKDEIQH